MMFVLALFALAIAVLVGVMMTAVFSGRARPTEPHARPSTHWMDFWPVLFLIFLAVWAGGLWVMPIGPTLWGIAWVPLLLIGLIFALFWAAIAASAASGSRWSESGLGADRAATRDRANQATRETAHALSIFFWVLLVILAVAILARAV